MGFVLINVIISRGPSGNFGLRYKGPEITFLTEGAPAEKTGQIEVGDKILVINGIHVPEEVSTKEVTSLIGKSQKSVSITLQRKSTASQMS